MGEIKKIPQIGEYWQYENKRVYQIVGIENEHPMLTGLDEGSTISNMPYVLTLLAMAEHKNWKQYFLTPQIINDYAIF